MTNDAPRDWAYNTRTGITIPMPVKAAQTASDTASRVLLRSIKSPTSEKKLHTFIRVEIIRGPLLWWIETPVAPCSNGTIYQLYSPRPIAARHILQNVHKMAF